jgi:hypothetical protein
MVGSNDFYAMNIGNYIMCIIFRVNKRLTLEITTLQVKWLDATQNTLP